MRSMFFRLFLGFWVTVILGGAVSVAVVSTFQHFSLELLRTDMSKRFDENLARLIVLSGQAAWDMYRCGGEKEYETYVNGLAAGAGTRISLIREDNRSITGERMAGEIVGLAEAARKRTGVFIRKSGETLTVVKRLAAGDGRAVVVVGVHTFRRAPGVPPPPDGGNRHAAGRFLPPFFHRGEILRTAIMLIVVSAVCYLLARSLTLPIRKLQNITRQIAKGDYSARVGASLGRAGSEITDLGRDFDVMVERTEKMINARKRLLRDISHELRSPLARLNVALELVRKRFDAKDEQSLHRIEKEAVRLNELIGQLLILARLEGGAGMDTVSPVELSGLVAGIVEDVDFEASGNGRRVTLVSARQVVVSGSRELLHRAIENTVRNAVHYTAEGSRVEVRVAVDGGEARIEVADYGPGVPEQDLSHLFEPFYRVAEARERQSGGAGIGLAITEQAVKAHGGRLVAQNRRDSKGLIVTIVLPLSA